MYSLIDHLAHVIWLGRYSEENLMALCAAYLDASGEPAGYTVMTVAGMVAPVEKWKRFEVAWTEALAKESIKVFHMTDFASSNGEFAAWKENTARRKRFIGALVQIVRRHTNKLLMASVELDGWRSVNRAYLLEEQLYSPYALCGYAVVGQGLQWAKNKGIAPSHIKFVFEDGDSGKGGLSRLCKQEGITPLFQPKSDVVPCQAADLIAWKNRIAFTNALRHGASWMQTGPKRALEGIDKELESLTNVLVRPGQVGIFSRETLLDLCRNKKFPKRGHAAST